uniref:HTH psq-type domain-containing protein n=1 Tax=Amphimedon queenslandica TaxID=400682 RepID=A0A1X7V595_AMPQE
MASEKYSVPKSTLHDRVMGKTDFEARPGPSYYLSFKNEEELACFFIKTAKIGYPCRKRQVKELSVLVVFVLQLQMGGGNTFAKGIPK